MELSAWISGRERAALRGVRLYALCLCGALLVAAGWLGWRETRLAGLPAATRAEANADAVMDARLRLKQLSLALYLTKVTQNALLADIPGITGTEDKCLGLEDLRSLPADSPCAATLRSAMERVWTLSSGEGGSKLDEANLRDPWNSPLMLNLSEQSCGKYGSWCPEDTIGSAGPDGKPNTPDDMRETVLPHLGPAIAAKAVQ
ncbi:hypothetical protein [Fundidesulfovibrio putealis]|uniref:hypothetical protein n=1 Tax=Fundidesulfovibrio putealis TaxID=270496 RepID=UPI000427318A|nr:hypothetical protein [Fundidesulfovibrio putealis]